MILANKGTAKIEGNLLDIVFEFDELFRVILEDNPELIQAVCNIRGQDILSADVDSFKYTLVEDMLRKKKEMEESGEYDD